MRTPEDIVKDLKSRGRTPEQIRAVAVAMNNEKLRVLAEAILAKSKTAKKKSSS